MLALLNVFSYFCTKVYDFMFGQQLPTSSFRNNQLFYLWKI
jgi:hypothetical protein